MSETMIAGSRDSKLAMWQTRWVKERLSARFGDISIPVVAVKAKGDRMLDMPLAQFGDKGLFTRELDNALLSGEIDFAVHSLKDLPTEMPEGLIIAAVTTRWDCRDALIARDGLTLETLPPGAVVATGSLRRQSQLLAYRPDLRVADIRGNIHTRLKKFDDSDWHGMILAAAGLERMNLHERISQKISFDVMLPGIGQGSLAVVCRAGDEKNLERLKTVEDPEARDMARAERAFLNSLEGGCQVPIGARADIDGGRMRLRGFVGSVDGKNTIRVEISGPRAEAVQLGRKLASRAREEGAGEILAAIRGEAGK